MKLRLFTAGILLPGMIFAGSAENTDLSGYTGAETKASQESIVANGGFEQGADGWVLKKDCRIEKNGGRNGTAALRYERRNPKEYQLVGTPVKLEPGKFYRFGDESEWQRRSCCRTGIFQRRGERQKSFFKRALSPRRYRYGGLDMDFRRRKSAEECNRCTYYAVSAPQSNRYCMVR